MEEPNNIASTVTRIGIAPATTNNLQVLSVLLFKNVKGVVDGDNTQQAVVVRNNRHGQQVVFCNVTSNVLLVVLWRGGDQVLIGNLLELSFWLRDNQAVQRNGSGQTAILVSKVEVADGLKVLVQVTQAIKGVRNGLILRNRKRLRRHNTAGGVLAISQQLPNSALLLNTHQAQEFLGTVIAQLGDKLGCVVWIHLGQDARCFFFVQATDELNRHSVVVELCHCAGSLLVIKLGKYLTTQARVQALDDVSDVSRVQFVQRLVGDGELDVGEVALNQVHVTPRNNAFLHGVTHSARNAGDQVL